MERLLDSLGAHSIVHVIVLEMPQHIDSSINVDSRKAHTCRGFTFATKSLTYQVPCIHASTVRGSIVCYMLCFLYCLPWIPCSVPFFHPADRQLCICPHSISSSITCPEHPLLSSSFGNPVACHTPSWTIAGSAPGARVALGSRLRLRPCSY